MKPIDLVPIFLSIVAVGLVMLWLWRRRARKQPQRRANDWIPPKTPTAKIISLHSATKPRRRPF